MGALLIRCPHALVLSQQGEEPTLHAYLPARFGTGSDSLLAQIECPDKKDPPHPIVVFCEAHVLPDGTLADRASLLDSYCFGARSSGKTSESNLSYGGRPYVLAMERALKKAKFIPAEVDGVAVPVYFSFQVVIQGKDGCATTAFPNQGAQSSEFGRAYVAPQEILTDGGLAKRAQRLVVDPFVFPAPGVYFAISVMEK